MNKYVNLYKKKKTLFFLPGLISIFVISRLWIFGKFFNSISGDNAIWGIMSMDILQGKAFPLFFYGASRTGSLETFFTAIFFGLGDISTFVYHFSRIIIFIPFILIVYFTVSTITNEKKLGLLASLWAVFPSYYFVHTAANCAGYIFFLIGAGLIYLISLPLQKEKIENKRKLYFYLFLFGFVSGFAFWLHQLSLSFILIISMCLVIRIKRKYPPKLFVYSLFIIFISFIIGSLPLIIYNILFEYQNFKVIFGFLFDISSQDELTKLGLLSSIKKSFLLKISGYGVGLLPRLSIMASLILGLQWDLTGIFPLINSIIMVIWGILFLLSFYCFFSGKVESAVKKQIYVLLAISGVVFVTGFIQDRYLLPFYFIIPVLICITLKNLSKKILFPLIILLIILNIYSAKERFTKEFGDIIPENNSILNLLEEKQLTRGFAEFNVAYPIMFLSKQEIIVSTLAEPPFSNNIPRFNKEVEKSSDIFYIYSNDTFLDKTLKDYLQKTGINYQVQRIGNFNLYYKFGRKLLPIEFFPEEFKAEYLASRNRRED